MRVIEELKQGKHGDFILQKDLEFKEKDGDTLLVVPQSLQKQVIRKVHENGHFAAGKTEDMVKRMYWFPEMRKQVEKVIRNCLACILAEKKGGKQEGWLHVLEKGTQLLDCYHIDHLDPMASTAKSYEHLLVVVDSFTK